MKNPYGQKNQGGRCVCAAECGRTFGGLSAFDTHRINMTGKPGYDPEYDWRCATDEELEAKGVRLTAKGVWSREASFSSSANA